MQLEQLEPRLVLDSTAVFNEIMYNPAGDVDDTQEWIELYNQLAVDMDLSDWTLEGAVRYTFPDGTRIPGRGYLLVAASPADLEATGVFAGALGPWEGSLDNSGDEIRLINNDGRNMNTVQYNDKGDWPVGPDGSGASLTKIHPKNASEPAESWTSSLEIGGTPGVENFEAQEPGSLLLEDMLEEGEPARALVPTNGNLALTWTDLNFNDTTWLSGNTGVGYDQNADYLPHIGLSVDAQMNDINQTVYIRVPFQVNVDPADVESLFLRMKYDDAFVAYVNGTEVARGGAVPGALSWNSGATGIHDDGEAVTFIDFNITANKNLLNQGGANVLAIHGLNSGLGSSDMLISPEIGFVRVVDDGGGGPIDVASTLILNELESSTETDFWLELNNFGSGDLDLEGVVIVATGIPGGEYVFGAGAMILGGEYLVIDEATLGFQVDVDEKVFLYSPGKTELLDANVVKDHVRGRSDAYDGQWHNPDVATPGAANSFAFQEDIVINEIMYHTMPQFAPFLDDTEEWIELYNRGPTDVDLSGWELDDAVRFDFAAGTVLRSGEYLVVAQDSVALAAKYPDIDIVGDFRGTLSNRDDRIRLIDNNNNPADDVHYFEAGQWPEYADGGGSSLELRDPFSDNSKGGAWAASDETSKSQWNEYTVTVTATEPLNCCSGPNELNFGLLDSGEFLIDDVSVVRGSQARVGTNLIRNSTFETPISNTTWRLIGNHDGGGVVADPDDDGNQVLHVIASGGQQHIHDHVEASLTSSVSNSQVTVAFRAKWLGGNNQLNHRFYFTRASNTFVLDTPDELGTPGAVNSAFETNIGPTYENFGHTPILPPAGEPVTVTVDVQDPDGVNSTTLRWNINGGAWTNVVMTGNAAGRYTGTIPGASSGQVIQFYVEGQDGAGVTSTFPAAGPNSRALYQVNDGRATSRPIESIRLVMLSSDNTQLFGLSNTTRMSNKYVGGTVIRSGQEAFYDIGIRQVGSRWIRPNSGYKAKLNPEHKFYGVHGSIRLDINGLGEILMKQMVNRAGGSEVSMYDDLAQMISPQHGSRMMLLNLARYEGIYLDEQFENGRDGTKWELDDITYPTGNSGGLKNNTAVSPQDMFYRGPDPEAYRGQLLIKNNRAKDEYGPLVAFTAALQNVDNLGQTEWNAQLNEVMDVDLWMRHYATRAFLGDWDTYGFRRPKNLRIYLRPEDNRIIPLYWDADLANFNETIVYNGGFTVLDTIRNLPTNLRLFWGHMWDLTNRSFNQDYATYWSSHYGSLGGGTVSAGTVGNRANSARAQARSAIPQIDFSITTNGGASFSVDTTVATIVGDGWIDVREIRLAGGSGTPLNVTWTDQNSWRVNVAIDFGPNLITIEAFDFEGNFIGSDSITITSTNNDRPLRDNLRISELNFNPPEGNNDPTEFIELVNIAPQGGVTIDLTGVVFTDGIDFDFTGSSVTSLAPGERVVVVRNAVAFDAMYSVAANEINVAGQYEQALDNGGERIILQTADGIDIHNFVYNDAWYPVTDGGGFSLNIVDPIADLSTWDVREGWRPSQDAGGSPGLPDGGVSPADILINEILVNAATAGGEWIELRNTTDEAIDLSHWYLSDDAIDSQKYQFPEGTELPANGYLVRLESADFGPGFTLNKVGGEIHLRSGNSDGEVTGFHTFLTYGGAETDMTFGLADTTFGTVYAALVTPTQGGPNFGPAIAQLAINEIMYFPQQGSVEFIELKNTSDDEIVLNDGVNAWQFVDGINYAFPVGAAPVPAGGFVVLIEDGIAVDDEAAFRSAHGGLAGVAIYVYTPEDAGRLENSGERLALARPGETVAALIVVEVVDYDNVPPWPTRPNNGDGPSLSRLDATIFANDATSWGTGISGGTPGAENQFFDTTPPSVPTGLSFEIGSGPEVTLNWLPSTESESEVAEYIIYRDDSGNGVFQVRGISTMTSFTEPVPVAYYAYQVSAVNTSDVESTAGAPLDVRLFGVTSAFAIDEQYVRLTFTEEVEALTAENTANYLVGGASVDSAVLESGNRSVVLETSFRLDENVTYAAVVNNVTAVSGALLPPDAQAEFTLGVTLGALKAEYFNNTTFSGVPIIARIETADLVGSSMFDRLSWGVGSPDPRVNVDNFSIRWSGMIHPEFTDRYQFTTLADEHVKMTIDLGAGPVIVLNETSSGQDLSSGFIQLTGGQAYPFELEFKEFTGSAILRMLWQSDNNLSGEFVPTSAFSTGAAISPPASPAAIVAVQSSPALLATDKLASSPLRSNREGRFAPRPQRAESRPLRFDPAVIDMVLADRNETRRASRLSHVLRVHRAPRTGLRTSMRPDRPAD